MPCNASHVLHLMLRFEHQDLGSAVHVAIRRMQRHLAGARPMRQQQCKDATCGLEVMHPRRTLKLRAQHRAASRRCAHEDENRSDCCGFEPELAQPRRRRRRLRLATARRQRP
jgi:hypothetical protein